MEKENIHEEISKWQKIDNLIEWKKFQYSNLFPLVFWCAGIILAMIILTFERGNFGLNVWIYLIVLFLLIVILFLMLALISKGHKTANENIEYLYRKKDGQKV